MNFKSCRRVFTDTPLHAPKARNPYVKGPYLKGMGLSLGAMLAFSGPAFALDLTEGDDVFLLDEPADVTEDVDALGEDTVDELLVTGAGTTEFGFDDFELMTFGGTDWTFDGALAVGEANVNTGILRFNGTVTGAVNVAEGATLGGTGIITGLVTNAGTIAPGNSIGTLNVFGDVVLQDTGTLSAEVDADAFPISDRLNVTGSLTIEGGELHLIIDDVADTEANLVRFRVADAAGGVTGAFDSIRISQAGDPEVSTNPATELNTSPADAFDGTQFNFVPVPLTLDGVPNHARPLIGMAEGGVTINWLRDVGGLAEELLGNSLQIDVGTAIQGMRDAGETELLNLVDDLTVLQPLGFLAALDALDGAEHLSLLHAQRMTQERFITEVSEQMRGPTNGFSGFLRGYWASTSVSDDDLAQGFSGSASGVIGGVSAQVGRYLQVGAAVAFETSTVDFDDDLAEADIDSFQFGGFAHLQDRTGLFGTLLVSYADHSNDVSRGYALGTRLADPAPTADYDATGKSAYIDIGKTYKLDAGSYVIPHVSFLYSESDRDAVIETASGLASAELEEVSATSALALVGLDSWFRFDFYIPLAIELEGGVQYEFGDRNASASTVLRSGGSASVPYTTHGVEPSALALKFGASVQGAFTRGLLWKIRYDGQFGDLSSHAGIFSLHVTDDIF